ncbi:nitrophenyl compound nitroreductase subunit ArsF family protein [Acetobacteroides hydrogenigenes]|uniref:Thioredoxin domain-containing protein n=1 Tax=Acetobacteroides hydrogenigenes TaxID=979970 RepID=A0A4R2ECB3_9BACT|nr:nitrophenyl compound nitroreductase subunit ArsF family protein [Acetobacteroides hydrogenigenes]TCN64482.1 hypothetical protein CLV25_1136 [Acetobacteroides hydrogenigenes]
MKQILLLSITLMFAFGGITAEAKNPKKATTPTKVVAAEKKVEVYYFHFTRRCKTCMAVEANAQKAVETLYADKVKRGLYTFKGLNLDDASTDAIAKKLGVGGQALLVVSGKNKVDITSKGFMNANDLEKMKEEVKKAVDNVTKG